MRLLIAEREPRMAAHLMQEMKCAGFSVDAAFSEPEVLLRMREYRYDAAVFDADSCPGALLSARARGASFPILTISSDDAPAANAVLLDAGADDCLPKPFAVIELVARLRALLRRAPRLEGSVLRVDDLALDTLALSVSRGGRALSLGRQEFALLEYLMRHAGVPLTRGMILEHAWDMNADTFSNTVDAHICFLRAKIDGGMPPEKRLIRTVRGYGYKIETGADA